MAAVPKHSHMSHMSVWKRLRTPRAPSCVTWSRHTVMACDGLKYGQHDNALRSERPEACLVLRPQPRQPRPLTRCAGKVSLLPAHFRGQKRKVIDPYVTFSIARRDPGTLGAESVRQVTDRWSLGEFLPRRQSVAARARGKPLRGRVSGLVASACSLRCPRLSTVHSLPLSLC